MQDVLDAAHRAANLTKQLLAFSRQQVLDPRIMDLNESVMRAERLLGRLLGEDIRLRTRLAGDLGKTRVDPTQIEQVIVNLAVNARDAMPGGGQLLIETANADLDEEYVRHHPGSSVGPHVMLAVTDTGTGMDEATQARIFEPFFTTKELGKGTGLGLSTIYGIVKQSGGSIYVYSEVGRGTTFKIYLPRVPDQVDAEERAAVETPMPAGSEVILVAEDAESVRETITRILTRLGYTVIATADAAEALERAEREAGAIDLLITDVVMPGMSGRQLAERLCATRPAMRVLYVSGYTDDSIVQHGILEGGIQFLAPARLRIPQPGPAGSAGGRPVVELQVVAPRRSRPGMDAATSCGESRVRATSGPARRASR
jgi:two-component system cell cycle sensor histidine kinase/response regulator CckA